MHLHSGTSFQIGSGLGRWHPISIYHLFITYVVCRLSLQIKLMPLCWTTILGRWNTEEFIFQYLWTFCITKFVNYLVSYCKLCMEMDKSKQKWKNDHIECLMIFPVKLYLTCKEHLHETNMNHGFKYQLSVFVVAPSSRYNRPSEWRTMSNRIPWRIVTTQWGILALSLYVVWTTWPSVFITKKHVRERRDCD